MSGDDAGKALSATDDEVVSSGEPQQSRVARHVIAMCVLHTCL